MKTLLSTVIFLLSWTLGWTLPSPPNPFGEVTPGEPAVLTVVGVDVQEPEPDYYHISIRLKLLPKEGPVVVDSYYANTWFEISVNGEEFHAIPYGIDELRESREEDWVLLRKDDPKYSVVSYEQASGKLKIKTVRIRLKTGFKVKGEWGLYQIVTPLYEVKKTKRAASNPPVEESTQ